MDILLDANILLRLANRKDVQRDESLEALRLLRVAGHRTVIVPQVLYEYWVVATRPLTQNGLGMLPAEVAIDFDEIRRDYRLLDDESGVWKIWQSLVVSYGVVGKRAHDARLVAAMVRHGLTHLLTFNDQDFSRFNEIAVIAPSNAPTFPPANG
jgi:predicted nucleic acid-binding protein